MLMIYLFFTFALQASEVDNFSLREEPLADATDVLNREANRLLQEAVSAANKKGVCDRGQLLHAMKKRFRNHYQDKFARFVHKDKSVPRRHIKIKDSIYRTMSPLDSYVLGVVGPLWDSTASIIRMGEFQFGTDKWEHFFGRGLSYYRRHFVKGQSLQQVLTYGLKSESGFLGAVMTGVMSYGDLASNFKGMHFFMHLFGDETQYLTFAQPLGPYVVCRDQKWHKQTDVDLLNYVDASWDESINCSTFRNQKILNKVKKQMGEKSCPLKPEVLSELTAYYGEYAPYVLNTDGHGVNQR